MTTTSAITKGIHVIWQARRIVQLAWGLHTTANPISWKATKIHQQDIAYLL